MKRNTEQKKPTERHGMKLKVERGRNSKIKEDKGRDLKEVVKSMRDTSRVKQKKEEQGYAGKFMNEIEKERPIKSRGKQERVR